MDERQKALCEAALERVREDDVQVGSSEHRTERVGDLDQRRAPPTTRRGVAVGEGQGDDGAASGGDRSA